MTCKCYYDCKNITLQSRIELFQKFWQIANYTQQQNFLFSLITCSQINRRRHRHLNQETPELDRKQNTYRYFLKLSGKSLVQVCQKTFCETFRISAKRVKLLSKKVSQDDIVLKERRGGNRPRRQIELWKPKMIEFLSSLPSRESHYGREKTSLRYLSPDLNVTKLYKAFISKYWVNRTTKNPPVSRQWFNAVFKKSFRLSFGQPRVDTCPKCDFLAVEIKKAKTRREKVSLKLQQEIHHRKAEAGITKMKGDRLLALQPEQPAVISFDLQKQFYLPTLTHTNMYYSRQYVFVNFGIHLEDTNTAFFYVWDETTGKRGCNEISSCLFDYITSILKTPKKSVVFWSDNCGGQNKNQGVLALYISIIARGLLEDIEQWYPLSGHTFLSCDRDFGVIERAKKGKKPEVPKDLIEIIVNAKQSEPFFQVKVMETFYNWMELAKDTLDTKNLGISQLVSFKLNRALLEEGCVEVKSNYSDIALYRKVKIFKKGVTLDTFRQVDIQALISEPKIWSIAKIKDIENMIPYVKEENQNYYKELVASMRIKHSNE